MRHRSRLSRPLLFLVIDSPHHGRRRAQDIKRPSLRGFLELGRSGQATKECRWCSLVNLDFIGRFFMPLQTWNW